MTWDGAGNLPPEFTLVQELVNRGHAVDVLAQSGLQARIESVGGRLIPLQFVSQWSSADELTPEEEGTFYWQNCVFAREYAEDTTAALRAKAYDAVLVDSFLPYGIAAALSARVPTLALVHGLYGLLVDGPMAQAIDAALANAKEEFDQFGIGPVTQFQDLIQASDEIIVFSYREFDAAPSNKVSYVGPLRSAGNTEMPQRRYEGRPLVVVSLSTAYQSQGPLLQCIIDALGNLEVEAIVTTGPAIDPSSFRASENVTILQYTPHDTILPHADLLITHAGHGTVMSGITYGVPMLCMPMGRDQPDIAARVVDLGLGHTVDQGASRQAIEQAVAGMLKDIRLQSNSDDFAKTLMTHPGIDTATAIVETTSRRDS